MSRSEFQLARRVSIFYMNSKLFAAHEFNSKVTTNVKIILLSASCHFVNAMTSFDSKFQSVLEMNLLVIFSPSWESTSKAGKL